MTSRSAHGPQRLVAVAALIVLAGCASESTVRQYVPQIVTPYRIDIQQGNFITQDMLDKLAVGQTREQVRFIMGTPLVADMFHAFRWDYVFRASKGWRDPESRRLAIHFDADGRVARWETEGSPPPREAAATAPAAPAAEKPAPAAEKPVIGPEAPPKAAPDATGAANRAPTDNAQSGAAPASAPAAAAPSTADASVVAAGAASPPSSPAPAPTASAPPAGTPAIPPAAAVSTAGSALASTQPSATSSPTRVLAALESWRAAWAARDVERYLAMYAADFQVPAGLTRARWEAQRRERIRRPSFIVVQVVDPQVSIAGDTVATAVFTQVYESDSLKERGRKTLALVRQGSDWKIRDERFEK